MLSDSFFKINSLVQEKNTVTAHLFLNAAHVIFDGHFPGMPVVPGVCMVEMIKEIFEEVIGQKTKLKSSRHIKFLNVLNPIVHAEVVAEINYGENLEGYTLVAKIYAGDISFFKMDSVLVIG